MFLPFWGCGLRRKRVAYARGGCAMTGVRISLMSIVFGFRRDCAKSTKLSQSLVSVLWRVIIPRRTSDVAKSCGHTGTIASFQKPKMVALSALIAVIVEP